jgi:excisionase family DNA binding protein
MKSRELVDVNEAERLTGLKQQTLYKLARQGRLRSFKVLGRALRFERADVLALVQERPATASRDGGAH